MHGSKGGRPKKLTSLQQILGKLHLRRTVSGMRNLPTQVRDVFVIGCIFSWKCQSGEIDCDNLSCARKIQFVGGYDYIMYVFGY